MKKNFQLHQYSFPDNRTLIAFLAFITIAVLEYLTPPKYVMGYLYVVPILLVDNRSNYWQLKWLTTVAIAATMLNLAIPGLHPIDLVDITNRLVVAIALAITTWLLENNRQYQITVTKQEYELQNQIQLGHLKEDFAATLTHDLRSPLLGAVETIKAFQAGKFGQITSSQNRVLTIMMTSHQSTLKLVQTLSDVYRHDLEGLELQTELIDLVTLGEKAILELNQLASSRQISLCLGYGNSDFRQACWVNGDRIQLYRVFQNLITNAIDHSLKGGKVEIIFTPQSKERMVAVQDAGRGIKAAEIPLLFERFYQTNGDRYAKGSGLGLYLSRQIIEAHGGKIWAETRSPQGAIFKFTLPAYFPSNVK